MKLSPTWTTITPLSKFLALFFFILFNVLGFYLGRYYQHIMQVRQYLRTYRAEFVEKKDQAQSDDMSNWKTYRNEEYGFEFQYPPEYFTEQTNEMNYSQETNAGNIKEGFKSLMRHEPPPVVYALKTKINTPEDVYVSDNSIVEVWIFNNSSELSIENWFENYWYYPFNFGQAIPEVVDKMRPIIDTSISSQVGKSVYMDSMGKVKYTYLRQKNWMILFKTRVNYNEKMDMEESSEGSQIISTFRFLDESQVQGAES